MEPLIEAWLLALVCIWLAWEISSVRSPIKKLYFEYLKEVES